MTNHRKMDRMSRLEPVPAERHRGTRTRRLASNVAALLVLSLAGLLVSAFAAAPAQANPDFTDWTAASAVTDTASGVLRGVPVRLSGPEVQIGWVLDGTFTGFAAPQFMPALDTSDTIALAAHNPGGQYRITFDAPVKDPVLHLASVASDLVFPDGTLVAKLSGTLSVIGTKVSGVASGSGQNSDSNGTIQLKGTYTTISFTAKPTQSAPNGDGFYLQIGTPVPAWTDWTAASAVTDTASGVLRGVPVRLSGPEVQTGILDGTFTGFASTSWFRPALTNTDTIALAAQNPGYQYRITFDAAVKDPVVHLASVASDLVFPSSTVLTSLSGTLSVTTTTNGTTVSGVASGSGQNSDSNGTIQLKGTYTTIAFTAKPTASAPNGDGFYLQIGTLRSA
ncbi:MAG: hypothetical protein LC798_01915 [Chloroflexi bacterium]|nr:hypothetical protein [Chloroflexota bacterium]